MSWLPTAPYWLSAASALAAAVIAFQLPAIAAGAVAKERALPFTTLIGSAFAYLRKTPHLLMLMLQGVAIFTLVRIVQVNLFQPILASKQLPLPTFGFVMAGTTVCEIAVRFAAGG